MHLPKRPVYSSAELAQQRAEIRAAACECLALLLELIGLGACARDVRLWFADDLRAVARTLRATIVLDALKHAPIYGASRRTRRPHATAPGCRWRAGYGASPMRLCGRVFKGAGLSSRDPLRLAAAIDAVARDAARYAARLLARVLRGLRPGLLIMTRPPARALVADAPAAPICAADTS